MNSSVLSTLITEYVFLGILHPEKITVPVRFDRKRSKFLINYLISLQHSVLFAFLFKLSGHCPDENVLKISYYKLI